MNSNSNGLFFVGIAVGILFLIGAILYWTGWHFLGHGIKHGILCFGLAVVAFLFAAVVRPKTGVRSS